MFNDSNILSGLGEHFAYGTRVIMNDNDRTTHLSSEFINYLIVKYGPGSYLYDQPTDPNNKYNLPPEVNYGHNKYIAWVKKHGIPHFEMLFDRTVANATGSIVNDCFNAYIFKDNSNRLYVFGRSTCSDNKTSANCPDKSNDNFKGKYANMIAGGIFQTLNKSVITHSVRREKGQCDDAFWTMMHAFYNYGGDGGCETSTLARGVFGGWIGGFLPWIESQGDKELSDYGKINIFEIKNSDVTSATEVWNTIAQIVIAIVSIVLSIFTAGLTAVVGMAAIAVLRIISSKLILGQSLDFNDLLATVSAVIGSMSQTYAKYGNNLQILGYTLQDVDGYIKQGVNAYQRIQAKDYLGLAKDVFQMSHINMGSVQEFSQAYLNLDISKISDISGLGKGAVELVISNTKNSEMVYNFLANGEQLLKQSTYGYNAIGDVNVQQLLINAVAHDYSDNGKTTFMNLASSIPGSQYGIKSLLKSQDLSVDEMGSLIHAAQGLSTQTGIFDRLCVDGLKNSAIQNFSRGISDFIVPSILPQDVAGNFAEQIRKDVPEVKTLTILEAVKKQKTKTVFFPQFATQDTDRKAPTKTVYDKQFIE